MIVVECIAVLLLLLLLLLTIYFFFFARLSIYEKKVYKLKYVHKKSLLL